jgi:GNAT superfamily N-acetyltransferase
VDDLSVLQWVHALHNACRRDQPPPEECLEPIPFDFWITRLIEAPGALPDAFFLAKRGGEYVGMSLFERDGPVGVLQNGFTGVLPLYRGRGIARALKLRAIAYAREQGFPELRTGNHSGKGPMLRVNEILGFRKRMARARFEKELPLPGV